jgi:hypothetical protein
MGDVLKSELFLEYRGFEPGSTVGQEETLADVVFTL